MRAEAQVSGQYHEGIGLKELSPGAYKVNWRALSVDTHKTEGDFSFSGRKIIFKQTRAAGAHLPGRTA